MGRCGFAINGKLCCPILEKSAPNPEEDDPEEDDNARANAYANCPRYKVDEPHHHKCGNTFVTIGEERLLPGKSGYTFVTRYTFKNTPRKFIFRWDVYAGSSCTMINYEPCYAFPKKPEGASSVKPKEAR